jgi:hypothetical protein
MTVDLPADYLASPLVATGGFTPKVAEIRSVVGGTRREEYLMSMYSKCLRPGNDVSNTAGNLYSPEGLPGVSVLDGYLIHNMGIRS